MTRWASSSSGSKVSPRRGVGAWRRGRVVAVVLGIAHILGAISSVNALMSTRTSQGAIAWIVSLNTLPVVAVPAYWVFGRNKFNGYVTARHDVELLFEDELTDRKSVV